MKQLTKGNEKMPIDKSMTHEQIVQELMRAYKKNGKIGNQVINSEDMALRVANAIAYKTKDKEK